MKRYMLLATVMITAMVLLGGWTWAEGESTLQVAPAAAEAKPAEPVKPTVTWGDYKYTFYAVEPSSDIDPQSVIMHWETPSPYDVNWSAANYCHFYIKIEWPENLRPWDYMPLQLIVHTPSRAYHQFGKDCSNASFLWRRYCRYPSLIGNTTYVIFTMDTQGAPIDPNTAYLEVNGVLEVWDWNRASKLYYPSIERNLNWSRYGSTYESITHLADIPLWEILYGTQQ